MFFHSCVQRQTGRFLAEARRYFYVTPTSYLELLRSFAQLVDTKRTEVLLMQVSQRTLGLSTRQVVERPLAFKPPFKPPMRQVMPSHMNTEPCLCYVLCKQLAGRVHARRR